MISGTDLLVLVVAVALVVGFFLVVRRFIRRAEHADPPDASSGHQ